MGRSAMMQRALFALFWKIQFYIDPKICGNFTALWTKSVGIHSFCSQKWQYLRFYGQKL